MQMIKRAFAVASVSALILGAGGGAALADGVNEEGAANDGCWQDTTFIAANPSDLLECINEADGANGDGQNDDGQN
jgi:hypothetical protein